MSQDENKNGREPEIEVEPRAERRHYTSEYKQRILTEMDRAREPGEAGAILRREGLYSQIISKWRQQRQRGGLAGTSETKRGPKVEAGAGEIARLQHENEQLRMRLERAEIIIEVQKKVSQLFGLEESGRREPK
jgi:transposase-like protein